MGSHVVVGRTVDLAPFGAFLEQSNLSPASVRLYLADVAGLAPHAGSEDELARHLAKLTPALRKRSYSAWAWFRRYAEAARFTVPALPKPLTRRSVRARQRRTSLDRTARMSVLAWFLSKRWGLGAPLMAKATRGQVHKIGAGTVLVHGSTRRPYPMLLAVDRQAFVALLRVQYPHDVPPDAPLLGTLTGRPYTTPAVSVLLSRAYEHATAMGEPGPAHAARIVARDVLKDRFDPEVWDSIDLVDVLPSGTWDPSRDPAQDVTDAAERLTAAFGESRPRPDPIPA